MMTKWVRLLIVASVVLGASACMPRISPIASHVVLEGENKEADIVWLLQDNVLYRCTNTASGPVCRAVKTTQ